MKSIRKRASNNRVKLYEFVKTGELEAINGSNRFNFLTPNSFLEMDTLISYDITTGVVYKYKKCMSNEPIYFKGIKMYAIPNCNTLSFAFNTIEYKGDKYALVQDESRMTTSRDGRGYLTVELNLPDTGVNSKSTVQPGGKTIQFTCYWHIVAALIGQFIKGYDFSGLCEEDILDEDNYLVVNHKDLNHMNNRISNLEFVSDSDNLVHAGFAISIASYGMFNRMITTTTNKVRVFRVFRPECAISCKMIKDFCEEFKITDFIDTVKLSGYLCYYRMDQTCFKNEYEKIINSIRNSSNRTQQEQEILDGFTNNEKYNVIISRDLCEAFILWCNYHGYLESDIDYAKISEVNIINDNYKTIHPSKDNLLLTVKKAINRND